MKKCVLFLSIIMVSCSTMFDSSTEKSNVNAVVNSWHLAAAKADFKTYFDLMTADGVFIGTDPTENWQNQAFRDFSKPFFEKGKAWNFRSLERSIYFSTDKKTAWFDELLSTQMKICRGSGVLLKTNGKWKIAHYVLSMTVPNENTDEVIKLKTEFENRIIDKLDK